MHPNDDATLPSWQGFIFLVVGLLMLVFSPKLVALQVAQARRTDLWLLNLIGYDGEFFLSRREGNQGNESLVEHWREPGFWLWTVFTGLLLAGFGLAILLKVKGLHIGS